MLYTYLNRKRNSINIISLRSYGYPGQFNPTTTSVIKRLGSDLGQICTQTFTFLWPEDVVNQVRTELLTCLEENVGGVGLLSHLRLIPDAQHLCRAICSDDYSLTWRPSLLNSHPHLQAFNDHFASQTFVLTVNRQVASSHLPCRFLFYTLGQHDREY